MNTKSILKSMVLAIITVIFFSCSKKPSGEIPTINVLDAEKRELNISEIADDITYLPLANDSLLTTIKRCSI